MSPSTNPASLPLVADWPATRVEVDSTNGSLPIDQRVCLREELRAPLCAGQVRIGMLAMTISPADLLQLDGRYGARPALPYVPGYEGVAVVLAVADDVRDLAPGDRVLPMSTGGCWADERVMSRRHLVPISRQADVLQSAMLTANPASAWVMLRHLRPLAPGDWVVQNAANSAVGQCVRQIGAHLGLNILNVVRRPDAIQAGDGDAARWIVDDGAGTTSALREQAAAATRGAPIHLALDAVGGESSQALGSCLADASTLVVYGMMSGRPCQLSGFDLVFRGIEMKGFWLANWFAQVENREKARSLYPDLIALLNANRLHMDVEAVYPLDRIHDALAHAAREGRSGKVLLKGAWMDREAATACALS